jgi:hypothetical protein
MRPRTGGQHGGGARGGAEFDAGMAAGGAHDIDDVGDDFVGERNSGDDGAHLLHGVERGDGAEAEFVEARHDGAVAVAADDFELGVALGVIDDDLEEEAVELGFGEWIGALLLDRVFGGNDHEGVAERVSSGVDGDGALVHGLEEGRLSLWRSAIDFVGEQNLGEDGPFGEGELVGLEVEKVGAEDVARHEIWGELDAAEA